MSKIGDLFTKYGSDKNTNHKYGEFYDDLFRGREHEVELVLELGTAMGGGLLGFRDHYPNATVVGVDRRGISIVHPGTNQVFSRDRLELHPNTDILDYHRMTEILAGRQFDLIVEDAAHVTSVNLEALFYWWPYVKEGGYYVIEEWANIQRDRLCFDLFKGATLVETPYPFKPGHSAYADHESPELLVKLSK